MGDSIEVRYDEALCEKSEMSFSGLNARVIDAFDVIRVCGVVVGGDAATYRMPLGWRWRIGAVAWDKEGRALHFGQSDPVDIIQIAPQAGFEIDIRVPDCEAARDEIEAIEVYPMTVRVSCTS